MSKFSGKVVVITGSSSGIGRGLAERLAEEGAHLVLADVREGSVLASSGGGSNRFVLTDVGSEGDIVNLVNAAYQVNGKVDYFFSNAGISIEMDASATERDWARIVAVNQLSHTRVARHLVPQMLAHGGGHLVITASAASFLSEIMSIGYASTKYATYGIAEWLAYSYRSRGLKVSVACPGPVWTPLIDDIPYLHDGAITSKEAADAILLGVIGGEFFITTHADLPEKYRQKAADPGAYVDFLVGFRDHALSLRQLVRADV